MYNAIDCGLSPIPMFGVVTWHADGIITCACGNPDCTKNAGKHPRIRGWNEMPKAGRREVDYWRWQFRESPDSPLNWAFHLGLSGVLGLDIDPRNGGAESWAEIVAKHGPLPRTPIDSVKTRGWHAWLAAPPPSSLPSHTSKVLLAPGVEMKWGNNYFAGPPSTHRCGHDYRWDVPPWDAPFAAPPQWLLDLIHQVAERTRPPAPAANITFPIASPSNSPGGTSPSDRARAYVSKIPGAVSGQGGHDATFHVACVLLLDFALPFEAALSIMEEWNQTCQPPWTKRELVHKLNGAARQPGERGRLLNADRPFTPDAHRRRTARAARLFAEIDAEIERAGLTDVDVISFSGGRVVFGTRTAGGDGAAECRIPVARDLSDLAAPLSDAERAEREREASDREQTQQLQRATERIEELRRQSFRCPRCRRIGMEEKATGRPHIGTVRCESWRCSGCGRRLREEWKVNVEFHLGQIRDGKAFRAIVSDERRRQLPEWIRDHGSNYFATACGEDSWLITSDGDFPEASPCSASEAAEQAKGLLDTHYGDGRPIFSSHAWAIKAIRPKGESKYRRKVEIPNDTDDETIKQILSEVGAVAVDLPVPQEDGHVVRFQEIRRRGRWTKELKDHLYLCLGLGERIPFVRSEQFEPRARRAEANAAEPAVCGFTLDLTG